MHPAYYIIMLTMVFEMFFIKLRQLSFILKVSILLSCELFSTQFLVLVVSLLLMSDHSFVLCSFDAYFIYMSVKSLLSSAHKDSPITEFTKIHSLSII
jgi:hypothetical protein